MGRVKEYFYNTECDCCGSLCNDEYWRVDETYADEDLQQYDWIKRGDKYYCPNCWHYDENDNVETADGRVWDDKTDELIAEIIK